MEHSQKCVYRVKYFKRGEPSVAKHDRTSYSVGGILREMRDKRNLSRKWVADHVDFGVRHLAAIELREKTPSIDALGQLLRCYGESADRIFYPNSYNEDSQLAETTRLLASCSPKQC